MQGTFNPDTLYHNYSAKTLTFFSCFLISYETSLPSPMKTKINNLIIQAKKVKKAEIIFCNGIENKHF